MTADRLNWMQEAFVREYCTNGGNGKQAAIAAGYAPQRAEYTASRLVSQGKVRRAIDQILSKATEKAEVSVELVLRELLRFAAADINDAFDEHGQLLPLKAMPVDVRRAISGIDITTSPDGCITRKVRFWSKEKGLEMIGRHLKMFTDKVEHSGNFELAEKLERARSRVKA